MSSSSAEETGVSGEAATAAHDAAKALVAAAATDRWKSALRAVRRSRSVDWPRGSKNFEEDLSNLMERLQLLLAGAAVGLDHAHRDELVNTYSSRIEDMLLDFMKPDEWRLISEILERGSYEDDDGPTVFTVLPSAKPENLLQVGARSLGSSGEERRPGTGEGPSGRTPLGYVYTLLTEPAVGRQWPILTDSPYRATPGSAPESETLHKIIMPPNEQPPGQVYWRDDLLTQLYELVDRPDGNIHVLSGAPGAGRTTVATAVAGYAKSRGFMVWWVPCGSGYTHTAMSAVAALLGAPPRDLADARAGRRSLPDLVWALLEKAEKPWLMVMDDLDDADAPTGSGPFAWARHSLRGLVLVTTRAGSEPKDGYRTRQHYLSAVFHASAARTLVELAPEAGPPEDAEQLSERLGGLPLSLSLAAAYLREPGSGVSTFQEYLGLIARGAAGAQSADASVITLDSFLNSLLDRLKAQGVPQARQIIYILSHFAAGVPLSDFVIDSIKPEEYGLLPFADDIGLDPDIGHAIARLERIGILRNTGADTSGYRCGSLQTIPAIAQACRKRLGMELPSTVRAVRAAAAASIDSAVRRYTESEEKDWATSVCILPHVFSLLANISPDSPAIAFEKAIAAACVMAGHLLTTGAYLDAENLAMKARGLGGSLKNGDHPLVLETNMCLAHALMARRRFGQAEELIRQVLSVRQRVLGPGNLEILETLEDLAVCLRDQGRLRDAESLFGQVFTGRCRLLGEDHPDSLRTLASLGEIQRARGDVGHAERSLRRVAEGRSRAMEPDEPSAISALTDLAAIQRNAGRLSDAESTLLKVMWAAERRRETEDPETLAALIELAATYRRQGRLADARGALDRALEIRKSLLGRDDPCRLGILADMAEITREGGDPRAAYELLSSVHEDQLSFLAKTHPDVLSTEVSLGIALRDLGKWDRAEEVLRSAIAGYEMVAGPDHPVTLSAWHNLATVLLDTGRFDEAESICKRVVDQRDWTLGPNHPDTLDAQANIACLLRSKGKLTAARDAFSQVLAGYEGLLGPEHPVTVTVRANLAGVLCELGSAAEADFMCRVVVRNRDQALGELHPYAALARINLATVLAFRKSLAEAEQILQEVLRRPGGGQPSRPGWTAALYTLASVYRQTQRLDEARRVLREVVDIRTSYFGSDHPETLAAQNELARVLKEMGRGGEADREYRNFLEAAERFVLEGCD